LIKLIIKAGLSILQILGVPIQCGHVLTPTETVMSSLSLPSPTLSTPAWRIAVVGCTFSLIWSSAFIAGKQAMTGCGPFTLLSLRFLAAGALLWLLRRWLPGDTPQQAAAPAIAWRHALIAGLLTNVVYLGLGYHGLRHVPAGLTAILVSVSPLLTAAMAALWLREPLGARQLLGLLCGMGGVAWIMAGRSGGASALDHKAWLGVGMILAGALALAASTLYNRRAAGQLNPWRIARRLAQPQRRHGGGQQRADADQNRRQPGRHMTQAVIAQPQIHHIGQQAGDQRVPPGDGRRGGLLRRVAGQPAAQQPQQRAGRQKAQAEQGERAAAGHRLLAGNKGRAPDQAEGAADHGNAPGGGGQRRGRQGQAGHHGLRGGQDMATLYRHAEYLQN
jgi:uncharacterized membrane protein